MEVFKILCMYILGITGIIKGIGDIKKNTNKPFKVILFCILMSIGIIGCALYKKIIFMIMVLLGAILILVLG